jgi:4-amino-4-deoxy-L-arabinose transferase-like glycosyltransferase
MTAVTFDRFVARVREGDEWWVKPSLGALLVATLLLYVLGLSANGYANEFYAAAVQAGSHSWKAFFFGSFDSSNFITVAKPPASLWVMDISARIFGVSSWSILLPQALEGVAAVWLLFLTVRRRFGAVAGLIAGLVLATTPVAVLMFRFDNPDALLTLLLVAAAYAVTRSLERGSTRWLALAGALLGLGFLTKMLQILTVVPGFALVFLLAAPGTWWRRISQLLIGGVALVVSAGWWVAVVALWPASSRPYIGGSQDNSILNLIFGYNGFGRLSGNESGSVVGGGNQPGAGAWGPTGITRLFGSEMGTQISWLIPAALIFGVVLLVWRGRASRRDGRRAAVVLWLSWLVVTGLVFSFAQGIIHPYYTVALAPAIGALVGAGAVWAPRRVSAAALAASAVWAFVLLDRSSSWHPWLRWIVLAGGIVVAVALVVTRGGLAVAAAAVTLGVSAPAAFALSTASTPHSGALPTAGPASAGARGGGPGGFGGGARRSQGPPTGAFGGGAPPQGRPGGFGGNRTGGLGGLLNAQTPSAALVQLLQSDSPGYRWVAATVGSNSAAGVQLATGAAIMAIGGFNGTDPTPTLAQFKQYVADGKVHYFLSSGGGSGGGFGGNDRSSNAIATWVAQNFTAKSIGGTTVYDLSSMR